MRQKRMMRFSKVLTFSCIALLLFSFSSMRGGEGYEVFLNNKVLIQQFGTSAGKGHSLSLEKAQPTDVIKISYHSCGNVGNNRVFSIRDTQGKVLKEWRSKDGSERIAIMTCQVKEITTLQNGKSNQSLQIFYSSSELPKGRLLASVTTIPQKATASLNR